jgi:hypothetical protein
MLSKIQILIDKTIAAVVKRFATTKRQQRALEVATFQFTLTNGETHIKTIKESAIAELCHVGGGVFTDDGFFYITCEDKLSDSASNNRPICFDDQIWAPWTNIVSYSKIDSRTE